MAFKLGQSKGLQANGGNIKSKFNFKSSDLSVPGTPVYVTKDMDPNDPMVQRVLNHEMQHVTAMKIGTETYDDNAVYFNGEVWPRGDGYIMNPHTGEKLQEGDTSLPWEANKLD